MLLEKMGAPAKQTRMAAMGLSAKWDRGSQLPGKRFRRRAGRLDYAAAESANLMLHGRRLPEGGISRQGRTRASKSYGC